MKVESRKSKVESRKSKVESRKSNTKNVMKQLYLIICLLVSYSITPSFGQVDTTNQLYWKITKRNSIVLDLTKEKRLPHSDNIEMAGKNVAAIIYYDIDKNRNVTLKRDVIFPQLRTYNKSNEPDWKKYRAYFRRTSSDEVTPNITLDDKIIVPSQVDSIEIGGMLILHCTPVEGLKVTKTIYPSMEDRFVVEKWTLENIGTKTLQLKLPMSQFSQQEIGYKGQYVFTAFSPTYNTISLESKSNYEFPVYYGATLNEESNINFNYKKAYKERTDFLAQMQDKLQLITPDDTINTLFYFSKIRASESIFNSSMGLVHSPGGGNYYVGIWANDQVEYCGPFAPYLGYEVGNTAAYNAYNMFRKNIPKDDSHIPYAFEVDGNFPMKHLDRGDAAMTAYGTAHYLLAKGDKKEAEVLWELVEWCLEFCHNHRNEAGAVKSESDEMEGRIPTGTANLSTSTLYYGGLKYGSYLAKALGKNQKAKLYQARLQEMERVIENYFGATMEGIETYKYFKENKYLRHWICLPLTMGITQRQEGTLQALFEKLWTSNGILVELTPKTDLQTALFWDRATLYALRGGLKGGAMETVFPKLHNFSKKRLLGSHVPYVIEAYPENNMRHLSAESALYCRIYTEGLLGIEPMGWDKMKIAPDLPQDWNDLQVKNLMVGGVKMDIDIKRKGKKLQIQIQSGDKMLLNKTVKPKKGITVRLK